MKRIIRDIWDALRGGEHDYTKIPLSRAVLLLAIPMILETLLESVFALWDIYFVSKLGDDSTAVVGITESLMTVIYAIGIGIAMGATGIISRRVGENKLKRAAISSAQAINLGIALSLLIAIPGAIFSKEILQIMKADTEVIENGWQFTAIMLAGNGLIMLLFINNAIFRSAGNPAIALKVLLIANGINIILDPCLILGLGPFPKLGVMGAAVATNIGRGTGVIIQFFILFGVSGRIKLKLKHFRIRVKLMLEVIRLSGGGIAQFIIATSSWIVLYYILGGFENSKEIIAGYTIGIRLFVFFLLPAWGLANAAATLVGQNLGAKHPDRAQHAVWMIAIGSSSYMLLVTLLFLLVPESMVKHFQTSFISYEVALSSMRIISFGMVFYGLGMVLTQAFNGAGDTYTPTLINLIGFWIVEIPIAAYLANKTSLAENGVFYSIFIAESLIAILALLMFLRGKWKLKKV